MSLLSSKRNKDRLKTLEAELSLAKGSYTPGALTPTATVRIGVRDEYGTYDSRTFDLDGLAAEYKATKAKAEAYREVALRAPLAAAEKAHVRQYQAECARGLVHAEPYVESMWSLIERLDHQAQASAAKAS